MPHVPVGAQEPSKSSDAQPTRAADDMKEIKRRMDEIRREEDAWAKKPAE
jgi:hypothetical protein